MISKPAVATSSAGPAADPRQAGAAALRDALVASRKDTLHAFHAVRRHLPDLQVPFHPWVNPPLWELGHVGWFQEFWTTRNPALREGCRADPGAPRRAGVRAGADALYDSGAVPHRTRWSLALPSADETLADLARQLDATLEALAAAGDDDAGLYFFRLALLHEDMHHEAATYMAQALDIPLAAGAPRAPASPRRDLAIAAGPRRFGVDGGGFAFDNELPPFAAELGAFAIDSSAVSWADFLAFADDGGYAAPSLWTPPGRRWLEDGGATRPRYLVRRDGAWHAKRFGALRPLELDAPACHLTRFEAEAWCRWAGRRLPTELEWEAAACAAPPGFSFGEVWEWTASPFAPYAGFEPHPYRDYSAPWFDGRPVLRGASFATQPRMRHARYRNFFHAERNDVFAGFRSCSQG